MTSHSALIIALACATACAGSPPSPFPAPVPLSAGERALLGCYQVSIGPWRHRVREFPVPGGGDFTTPPAIIQLDSALFDPRDGGRTRRVGVPIGVKPSVHGYRTWRTTSAVDTVELEFSTGFSGMTWVMLPMGDSSGANATGYDVEPDWLQHCEAAHWIYWLGPGSRGARTAA
jgi:hypothetical protein